MNSNKFNHVHVYLIGLVLLIIVGAGLFFGMIRPVNEENKVIAADIASKESTPVSVDNQNFNISQASQAAEKLEELKKRQARKEAELAILERRKQLPANERIDLGDASPDYLLTRTLPRWLVLPRVVVERMGAYARTSARRYRNLRVQTDFSGPAPSLDPKTVPTDIIAWNLGPMVVRGRFNDVMDWVRNWNNAPLLTSVDGLRMGLADRGGVVEATCTLSVFIFPTGQAVTNPAAAGGGGGFGAPGGGFGAPGTGVPGAPGGGISNGPNGGSGPPPGGGASNGPQP